MLNSNPLYYQDRRKPKVSKSKDKISNPNNEKSSKTNHNLQINEQSKFDFNGLESYIRNLKKATAKNAYPQAKTRMIDTKQLNSSKLLK